MEESLLWLYYEMFFSTANWKPFDFWFLNAKNHLNFDDLNFGLELTLCFVNE